MQLLQALKVDVVQPVLLFQIFNNYLSVCLLIGIFTQQKTVKLPLLFVSKCYNSKNVQTYYFL